MAGNYLGNFIAAGSGGLSGPFAIYFRASDILVSSDGSNNVLRYDLNGAFLNTFASSINFPQQIEEAGNTDVLLANFSTPNSGVQEYTAAGTYITTYSVVTGNRGAYELGNGNILTSNGSAVYAIDRNNTIVATEMTSVNAQYIEYVVAPTASIGLAKTVGTDPSVCAAGDQITVAAGATVYYCYTVTNTGAVALTSHSLVDDHLGALLNNFPYNLAPSASAFLTAEATINVTTVNSATWTATDGAQTVAASDVATVTVQTPTALTLVNTQAGSNGLPGAGVAVLLAGMVAVGLIWRLRVMTRR